MKATNDDTFSFAWIFQARLRDPAGSLAGAALQACSCQAMLSANQRSTEPELPNGRGRQDTGEYGLYEEPGFRLPAQLVKIARMYYNTIHYQ